jgi:two-component system NarL family sensor kinase
VAQEAIHNVEKHANAQSVLITVSQAHDRLEITVDDDGCGLEPRDLERWKTGGHLGILGMRERVAALEGQFEVLRSPAGGTRVLVTLPLPPGTEVRPIETNAVETV